MAWSSTGSITDNSKRRLVPTRRGVQGPVTERQIQAARTLLFFPTGFVREKTSKTVLNTPQIYRPQQPPTGTPWHLCYNYRHLMFSACDGKRNFHPRSVCKTSELRVHSGVRWWQGVIPWHHLTIPWMGAINHIHHKNHKQFSVTTRLSKIPFLSLLPVLHHQLLILNTLY